MTERDVGVKDLLIQESKSVAIDSAVLVGHIVVWRVLYNSLAQSSHYSIYSSEAKLSLITYGAAIISAVTIYAHLQNMAFLGKPVIKLMSKMHQASREFATPGMDLPELFQKSCEYIDQRNIFG
jgi:hypothetical protein